METGRSLRLAGQAIQPNQRAPGSVRDHASKHKVEGNLGKHLLCFHTALAANTPLRFSWLLLLKKDGRGPCGLLSPVLQSLLSNKVGLFNKFNFKVGQGLYFCAWSISILK